MKIEHVAMYVNDLEGAKNFFIKYFDAKSNTKYHNTKTNFESYFLSFLDGDTRLEIMTKPNLNQKTKSDSNTGFIHLAFSLGSKEKVDELTERLEKDGYKVLSGPRITGDGYYESAILVFEDNILELTV